jgi:predicted transcriptional regulator
LSESNLTELTADIVSAYVENNTIPVADLPAFINSVFSALTGTAAPEAVAPAGPTKMTPAQIRKSITPDHLVSFITGQKFKSLKRHLNTQGMTVDQYKATYGLPKDYPTTSPNYSAARSQMALAIGLGQKGRQASAPAKPAKAARKPRTAKIAAT